MNIPATLRAPDREGRQDRRIQDPEDHLLRRLFLRDGRLRRPDPARHHLSRALGLHLAARPADLRAPTARPTRSASRWSRPTATCAPFQDVLLDLGARLGLPGFVNDDGTPRYPGGYPDYIVNHERSPGIGPLAGFRGEDGNELRQRRAQPEASSTHYIADGCFHEHHLRRSSATTSTPTRPISTGRMDMGFIGARRRRSIFQLYLRAAAEIPPRRARARRGRSRREQHRARIETYFDPLPFWYPPFEGDAVDEREFPLHAITQRPMAHVSLVGLAERLAAPDPRRDNRLYMQPRARREARHRRRRLGLDHERASAASRAQVKLMEGVNPDTVWTWNAIGKRAGAWRARSRRAGSDARLPAQSPDRRAAARARGRLPLLQQRSDHRPGGLVRPARPHREGRAGRGRRNLAAVRAAACAAAADAEAAP